MQDPANKLRDAVKLDRLLETATALVAIPSPTRSAAEVADRLAEILTDEGFVVERPEAGWPSAPAVVARLESGLPGPTLQFNGHLDTVHLPFVPPSIEDGMLCGSGASDMKGGIAAAVEAMRALRDTGLPAAGSVLLTAHDLHESPWGDGSQVDQLIRDGFVGDAVMLPEYNSDRLNIVGRGLAILEVVLRREGDPVHEVMGGSEQPSVIAAGADLVNKLADLNNELSEIQDPVAGCESLFVGKIASGEIYNQSPTEFSLSGTRRWIPGTDYEHVQGQLEQLLAEVASSHQVTADTTIHFVRDGYRLDTSHPVVTAFQDAARRVMGQSLPEGCKPFIDDGNTFAAIAGIPAITHGPDARGAHTTQEEVPLAELERVAMVYALTAAGFCCPAA